MNDFTSTLKQLARTGERVSKKASPSSSHLEVRAVNVTQPWRPCCTWLQSLSAVSSLPLWRKPRLVCCGFPTRGWTAWSSRATCCLRPRHAPSWTADGSVSVTRGAWRSPAWRGPHPGPVVDTRPSSPPPVLISCQRPGPQLSHGRVSCVQCPLVQRSYPRRQRHVHCTWRRWWRKGGRRELGDDREREDTPWTCY